MLEAIDVEQRTFTEVATLTGLDANILRHLVRSCVITGVVQLQTGAGSCDVAQARAIAERLHAARKQVEDNPITPTDAARKYGFGLTVLYKWKRAGWIRLVPGNKTLFNEGDLAFARVLADLIEFKAGKAIFPPKPRSGRPRKSKN